MVDLDYTEQRDEHTMTQRAESLQEATVFFFTGCFPQNVGGNDLITLVIVYIYIYSSICLEILQIPLFFADSERLFICTIVHHCTAFFHVLDRLSGELQSNDAGLY